MTIEANRHYEQIGIAYRSGSGLTPVKEMAERQINASVQNIIDFWLGIYNETGSGICATSTLSISNTDDEWAFANDVQESSATININTATPAEIASFFNITPAKAQSIADNRPFSIAYDLAKIDGITVHFVKRHKDRIRLQ
jgi:hypothetical protein